MIPAACNRRKSVGIVRPDASLACQSCGNLPLGIESRSITSATGRRSNCCRRYPGTTNGGRLGLDVTDVGLKLETVPHHGHAYPKTLSGSMPADSSVQITSSDPQRQVIL